MFKILIMKYGFVTCVELGLKCMETIYNIGNELELAITLKDNLDTNKSGRIFLDSFCARKKINLIKCKNINDSNVLDSISNSNIDWLFIIGWSQIAGKNILDKPNKGVLGMHPTLLPEGRGRAPIPWAIIKGLKKTGVTLFKLDVGVDTGLIVKQIEIPINKKEDASSLYEKVKNTHIELMIKTIKLTENKKLYFKKQNENKATYWPIRKPCDAEINLNKSVIEADRLIRAVTKPYPGARLIQNKKKIIIWKAKINKGTLNNGPQISFPDGKLDLIDFEEIQ